MFRFMIAFAVFFAMEPVSGGHSQNAELNSTVLPCSRPFYFGNAPHLGGYPITNGTILFGD